MTEGSFRAVDHQGRPRRRAATPSGVAAVCNRTPRTATAGTVQGVHPGQLPNRTAGQLGQSPHGDAATPWPSERGLGRWHPLAAAGLAAVITAITIPQGTARVGTAQTAAPISMARMATTDQGRQRAGWAGLSRSRTFKGHTFFLDAWDVVWGGSLLQQGPPVYVDHFAPSRLAQQEPSFYVLARM
jgi:hypothetical protein